MFAPRQRRLTACTGVVTMLEFLPNWDDDNNPKLSEADAKKYAEAAVNKYNGKDTDFLDLKNMVVSTNGLAKAKIAKGMHQDQGNQFLVERHMTVELPWWPDTKRYHLYFWQQKKSWYPVAISHEESKGVFRRIGI
jgi:hypothetical protein